MVFLIGMFCISILFCFSSFWTESAHHLLSLKKGVPNLFFDLPTIHAIGLLIGTSLCVWLVFFVLLFFGGHIRYKKNVEISLVVFLLFEGLLGFYLNNFFIPQSVVTKKISMPDAILNTKDYRIQSTLDVVPYTGFHTYLGNVLFRPPFSKEPQYIDTVEEKTFKKLDHILSCLPSNWMLFKGYDTVQGYNALVPSKMAAVFQKPSSDYRQEYSYIIARNPLFAQSEKGLDINVLETSRITAYDKRWGQIGVRYFISDEPLKSYELLWKDKDRYIYENLSAIPIFRIQNSINTKEYEMVHPEYSNPNLFQFQVSEKDLGKVLIISINPSGFEVIQDGTALPMIKEDLSLSIPITKTGKITVYYSPIQHFKETINSLIKRYEKIFSKQ